MVVGLYLVQSYHLPCAQLVEEALLLVQAAGVVAVILHGVCRGSSVGVAGEQASR